MVSTYRRGHSYRRNGKTFKRCGGSVRYQPGQGTGRSGAGYSGRRLSTRLVTSGVFTAAVGALSGMTLMLLVGLGFVVAGAAPRAASAARQRRRKWAKPQSHTRLGAPAGQCWVCKGTRPGRELTPTPLIFGLGRPKPICDYCMGRKKPRP